MTRLSYLGQKRAEMAKPLAETEQTEQDVSSDEMKVSPLSQAVRDGNEAAVTLLLRHI